MSAMGSDWYETGGVRRWCGVLLVIGLGLCPAREAAAQGRIACTGAPLTATPAPGWWRSEQRAVIPRDRSAMQVEQDLVARARQDVVVQASGVQVRSGTMRAVSETMQRGASASYSDVYLEMFRQSSEGRIVEERKPVCVRQVGADSLHVILEARVEVEREEAAAGFEGRVRTNQPAYREGDAIELELEASEPARVYLFAVDATGKATLFFPNRFDTLNVVRPRQARFVPARGGAAYALVAELNPALGAPHAEMVLGVFYRGTGGAPFAVADAFARSFTLEEINRVLLTLPRRERTEAMTGYEIRSADVRR